eukprot:g1080.t1
MDENKDDDEYLAYKARLTKLKRSIEREESTDDDLESRLERLKDEPNRKSLDQITSESLEARLRVLRGPDHPLNQLEQSSKGSNTLTSSSKPWLWSSIENDVGIAEKGETELVDELLQECLSSVKLMEKDRRKTENHINDQLTTEELITDMKVKRLIAEAEADILTEEQLNEFEDELDNTVNMDQWF